MVAVVNSKAFKSEQGFESPKFTVDINGRLTSEILDVKQILLNGVPFVGETPDEEGGGDTSNKSFENITDSSS